MSPMAYPTALLVVINLLATPDAVTQGQPAGTIAQTLSLTVLSTMLADTQGIGEWGFAADRQVVAQSRTC